MSQAPLVIVFFVLLSQISGLWRLYQLYNSNSCDHGLILSEVHNVVC